MRLVILLTTLAIGISEAAIDPINQDTLKKYLENGTPSDFILIDVRGSEEIQAAIGNAACKPYNLSWPEQFQNECTRIPKDATVVIYCRSGGRARNAVSYLQTNGYTNVHNAGGFLTWTGPTVPPSEIKPVTLLPEPSMRAATGEVHPAIPFTGAAGDRGWLFQALMQLRNPNSAVSGNGQSGL